MSKSLYEKYADGVQPGVLAKTISLEDAVESLKGFKGCFSKEYLECAEEVCADMFGRTFEEVRDLVDEKTYWISIDGMYEENSNNSEYFCRGKVYIPFGHEGLEQRKYIQLANEGENFLKALFSANSGFHHVLVNYYDDYVCGCVFKFTFSTGMDVDDIRRTLARMLGGLKHNFYLDYSLDAKLAVAAERSGETGKDVRSKNELEKE